MQFETKLHYKNSSCKVQIQTTSKLSFVKYCATENKTARFHVEIQIMTSKCHSDVCTHKEW